VTTFNVTKLILSKPFLLRCIFILFAEFYFIFGRWRTFSNYNVILNRRRMSDDRELSDGYYRHEKHHVGPAEQDTLYRSMGPYPACNLPPPSTGGTVDLTASLDHVHRYRCCPAASVYGTGHSSPGGNYSCNRNVGSELTEVERGAGNVCRIHYTHPYDSPRLGGSTPCGGGGVMFPPQAVTNIDAPKVYFEMDLEQRKALTASVQS